MRLARSAAERQVPRRIDTGRGFESRRFRPARPRRTCCGGVCCVGWPTREQAESPRPAAGERHANVARGGSCRRLPGLVAEAGAAAENVDDEGELGGLEGLVESDDAETGQVEVAWGAVGVASDEPEQRNGAAGLDGLG